MQTHVYTSQPPHWHMEKNPGNQLKEEAKGNLIYTILHTLWDDRELSRKAKLWIYRSIYATSLTYGHDLWVMTKRTWLRLEVAKVSFLCRVAVCSLRESLRSSVTWEEIGVEPLLLHVERSQLKGGVPGRSHQGVPEADPGHNGETLSSSWAGINFEYSLKNWRKGRGKSGTLLSLLTPHPTRSQTKTKQCESLRIFMLFSFLHCIETGTGNEFWCDGKI